MNHISWLNLLSKYILPSVSMLKCIVWASVIWSFYCSIIFDLSFNCTVHI